MRRNHHLIKTILMSLCSVCVFVLMYGCSNNDTESESLFQTVTTEAPSETTQIQTEPTTIIEIEQTEPIETEPTVSQHSRLYLPQYTTSQVCDYFAEIVLDMEYTTGDGDSTLVQKWVTPIYYRIYGEATEEDRNVINELAAQLNNVPGFPGIYPVEDGMVENVSIRFLNPTDFDISFSEVTNGEYAFGAVQFWYYNATNDIYNARIGCRTDIDQSARNSVIQEEIINALGISDTVLREDSIVYQYSNDNVALSDMDWIIINLLYDSSIQCGMNYDACVAVIEDLYY